MADFLENMLTGKWRLERRVGGEMGEGWGASALVMGQLHRVPPTTTRAPKLSARARIVRAFIIFSVVALPPTRHVPFGYRPKR